MEPSKGLIWALLKLDMNHRCNNIIGDRNLIPLYKSNPIGIDLWIQSAKKDVSKVLTRENV